MLDRLRIAYREGGVRPECAPATAATAQKRHCSPPFRGLSRRSSPPRDSQRAQKGARSPQDGGFGLFIWEMSA